MLMGTQYQRGINGVGSLRPMYGMGSIRQNAGMGDLPGYEGSDPANVIANIGEAVWNVWQNFAYIMGVSNPGDLGDTGKAGRVAVENKFASLVSPSDIASGNVSGINAAANTAIRYFISMYGGQPKFNCLSVAVSSSSQYASQVHQSFSWTPQTRCAQLAALLTGSGLNFVQIGLGGDGLGNMPSSSASTPTPYIGPSYQNLNPSPYAAGGAYAASLQNAGNTPPQVQPVVQTYTPPQQASVVPVAASAIATYDPQAAQAPMSVSPSSPAARLMVSSDPIANTSNSTTPSSSISPVGSSTTGGTNTVYVPYGMSAQSAPVVATPSATDELTSWVSANPLLAAGLAVGAFMLFGRGK